MVRHLPAMRKVSHHEDTQLVGGPHHASAPGRLRGRAAAPVLRRLSEIAGRKASREDALRYIACSGGADSVAMALLWYERGIDFELLFSDSGAELPETFWTLPRLAKYVGKPLHVVVGGTFFQHLVAYNYQPPTHHTRWCTRVLKAVPQNRWLKAQGAESVCIGIRADEPQRQKKWATDGWDIEWPLVEASMGKQDVLAMCRKHDMLNPVYEWRSHLSCFCCPMQKLSDWRGMLQHHPTLYVVTESWEQLCRADDPTRTGFLNGAHTLAELRQAKAEQVSMFDEPEGAPCLVCSR
jgi:hypothetical protein